MDDNGGAFVKSPANVTSSLGKPVQVHCTLQGDGGGEEPPDVVWLRDGQSLDYTDTNQVQVPVTEGGWLTISELRIDNMNSGEEGLDVSGGAHSAGGSSSFPGIPHFSVKPHDVTVVANVSLSLQCVAHGPPEPVRIIWLQNGGPLNMLQDLVSHSPSTLNITGKDCLTVSFACCTVLIKSKAFIISLTTSDCHHVGLNHTSSFSCEAHNSKGVATSASGTVTVVPSQAQKVQAEEVTNSSLHISWVPGFGGVYPVSVCSIQCIPWLIFQAAPSSPDRNPLRNHLIHNQNVNVPPAQHLTPELKPYTYYDVIVPEAAPDNVSGLFNGTDVIASWSKPPSRLNGLILGYRVEYLTLQVAAPGAQSNPSNRNSLAFSWHWWYVVMGIAVSLALIGFIVYAIIIIDTAPDAPTIGSQMKPHVSCHASDVRETVQGEQIVVPSSHSYCSYFLMFSCSLLSPKDRPGFPSLRCDLEKALEEMPEQEEADDLLYVNMEEPSGSLLGAIGRLGALRLSGPLGGWEPFGLPHPSYRKNMGTLETIQVHHHNHHAERYVLCPQHEAQPYLNDSMDSLSWMASSSSPTLQLQASRSSSPTSSLLLDGQAVRLGENTQ
ncbi:unnamed protein product [Coregonus sp. 'balchen']|nr:unnamed protein product [Coregonus sp. 'balchen']